MGSVAIPPAHRLPVPPADIFPLEGLRRAALIDNFYEKPYDVTNYTGTGNFIVRVSTPPYDYYREKRLELRLAKKRGTRGTYSGVQDQVSYDPFSDLKNWAAHTGRYIPVVSFEVQPKIGQTTGSTFLNLLGAAAAGASGTAWRGVYTYEFKGDLYDFKVYRNGRLQTDIMRSVHMQPLVFSASTWDGTYRAEDMAQVGVFTYPVDCSNPRMGIIQALVLKFLT